MSDEKIMMEGQQQSSMLEVLTHEKASPIVSTKTQKVWLVFAIALMALMINVDYTAVNLSLITIANHLQSNLDTIQWALSGYMLAWAAIIVPAGNKIDAFGQKRMCLIGICLFLLGSLLAGLSNSAWLFITSRVIQGISGAIYVPTLYALIFSHFSKHRLGLVMGLLSVGVGFGMAIGPTLGGVILHSLGWRWIFFINIPIALLALMIIRQFAKSDAICAETQKTDGVGAAILAICLVLFMYSLSEMNAWGLLSMKFIMAMLISAILFISFILWQNHSDRKPNLPFSLFRNRAYSTVVFAFFIEQYAFATTMILIALFLQKVLGIGVLKASLMFLALNLLFGAISPFGGAIVDKIGLKWPAFLGLLLFTFGLVCFSKLTPEASSSLIYFSLAMIGLGMGTAFSSLNSGMIKTIDAKDSGIASSVFLLIALLGNVCGLVISTLIYETAAASALIQSLQGKIQLSLSQIAELKDMVHYLGNPTYYLADFSTSQQQQVLLYIPDSLNAGIMQALLVVIIGTLIASAAVFCFSKNEK